MLITLMLVGVFAVLFSLSEVRIYRNGGDVYDWTVKFSNWLKQYGL